MTRKLLALLFLTVPVFAQSHQATRPPKPQTPDFSKTAPVPVQNGVFVSGKELLKSLLLADLPITDPVTLKYFVASGYIAGIADADEKVCMPVGTLPSALSLEMTKVLESYAEHNERPEYSLEKMSAGVIIRYALEHKYACPAAPAGTEIH